MRSAMEADRLGSAPAGSDGMKSHLDELESVLPIQATRSAPEPVRAAARLPVAVIEPSRGWSPAQVAEVWAYRELLYFFVWRELKVRYKQTALGVAWALIQPILTMIVFSVIFG